MTIYVSAQQYAQGELVSGTSGVVYKRLPPTTSQQAQSAKMKSQKPNYENEGDAWTIIPQESDESGTIKILNISMMYLYTEFPDIGIYRIL